MKVSPIPWHVFAEACTRQDPGGLDRWLARWSFNDAGVFAVGKGHGSRETDFGRFEHLSNDSRNEFPAGKARPAQIKTATRQDAPETDGGSNKTKKLIRKRFLSRTRNIGQVKCERCIGAHEARYRARTDAMDILLCSSCAAEAKRLGISVKELKRKEAAGSRGKRRILAQRGVKAVRILNRA